jgi:hypothetical protein
MIPIRVKLVKTPWNSTVCLHCRLAAGADVIIDTSPLDVYDHANDHVLAGHLLEVPAVKLVVEDAMAWLANQRVN